MIEPTLSPMDRLVNKGQLRYRLLLKTGIPVLVLSVLALVLVQRVQSKSIQVNYGQITISTVRQGTYSDDIPVTGKIVPIDTIYLDATEGGQVVKRHVEEGAFVKAGEPLVTLKNTALQLEVLGREAQVTEQVNSLLTTQLLFEQNRLRHKKDLIDLDQKIETLSDKLDRFHSIKQSGAISDDQLQALERDYKFSKLQREVTAEAQRTDLQSQSNQMEKIRAAIQNLNGNLEIARDNLKALLVTAPITGQVTTLKANVGESLAKGQRIGQIDELDAFRISAPVDEFFLSRLTVGQQGKLEIDGKPFVVNVTKIYPEVVDRQFKIDMNFATRPEGLRLGQTFFIRLELGRSENSKIIDYGPFYETTGGKWLFVLDGSGKRALRRDVQLGRHSRDSVEVIGGLEPGDRVIVSSYDVFADSQRVQIVQPEG